MNLYGQRYITSDQFTSYCSDLNIELLPFNHELELYEREGVLLPVARLVKPEEYLVEREKLDQNPKTYGQKIPQWSEVEDIIYQKAPSSFQENEGFWHPFDKQLENGNKFLMVPDKDRFRKWDSYKVTVQHNSEGKVSRKSAIHYYHYYQIYQVYAIQKRYPVFAKNNWVLKKLTENEIEYLIPKDDVSISLNNNILFFEALSFYIELFSNERERTFKNIGEEFGIKTLDDQQFEAYKNRLKGIASFVCDKFNLSDDDFYNFLLFTLELHSSYEVEEKFKLAAELIADIDNSIDFFINAKGVSVKQIEDGIKARNPPLVKKFRYIDKALEIYDYARETFERLAINYNTKFPSLKISNQDIDKLLDFMNEKGLFIVPNAIFNIDEVLNTRRAFHTNSLYVGLTNFSIGLESLLREIANTANQNQNIGIDIDTLHALIVKMFTWGNSFNTEHAFMKNRHANNAFLYLEDVYTSPTIPETIKTFLIAYRARNLIAHNYILDQYLYHDWYSKIYVAICEAIFYSWMYANKEGWL